MKRSTDLYRTLDVPPDATPKEIKRAYREKSKKAHPDAGGDAAEFARVSQAYAVLSVPDRRRRYDAGEDPSPPQPVNEAQKHLAFRFTQVLQENLQDESADLILRCRLLLEKDQKEIYAAQPKFEEQLAALKKRLKRIKRKKQTDEPDILIGVIEQQIGLCNLNLAKIPKDLETVKNALEMLQAWEMEPNTVQESLQDLLGDAGKNPFGFRLFTSR